MDLLKNIESKMGEDIVVLERHRELEVYVLKESAEYPLLKLLTEKGSVCIDYELLHSKREGRIFSIASGAGEFKSAKVTITEESGLRDGPTWKGVQIEMDRGRGKETIEETLYSQGSKWSDEWDITKFGQHKYVCFNREHETNKKETISKDNSIEIRIYQAEHYIPLPLERVDDLFLYHLSSHLGISQHNNPSYYYDIFHGGYKPIFYSAPSDINMVISRNPD